MANPKVMHGARGIVSVGQQVVGIISDINYNITDDTQDAYILGRTGPAEIGYVAQEPITGTISGWRVIDQGAYASLGLPLLKDLLTAPYTHITLMDRNDNKRVIGHIEQVRLLGHSGGLSARQFSTVTIPFKGIKFSDETATDNGENASALDLP